MNERIRYTGPNFDEVERFVGADVEWRDGRLIVPTRDGPLLVAVGQWIVRRGDSFAVEPADAGA